MCTCTSIAQYWHLEVKLLSKKICTLQFLIATIELPFKILYHYTLSKLDGSTCSLTSSLMLAFNHLKVLLCDDWKWYYGIAVIHSALSDSATMNLFMFIDHLVLSVNSVSFYLLCTTRTLPICSFYYLSLFFSGWKHHGFIISPFLCPNSWSVIYAEMTYSPSLCYLFIYILIFIVIFICLQWCLPYRSWTFCSNHTSVHPSLQSFYVSCLPSLPHNSKDRLHFFKVTF